jgi:hypothetical protein
VLARPEIAEVTDIHDRVNRLYDLLFGRKATVAEQDLAQDYLGNTPTAAVWESYVQGLLLLNEFVFLD